MRVMKVAAIAEKKKSYPANAGYMYIFSANINTNAIIPLTQKNVLSFCHFNLSKKNMHYDYIFLLLKSEFTLKLRIKHGHMKSALVNISSWISFNSSV